MDLRCADCRLSEFHTGSGRRLRSEDQVRVPEHSSRARDQVHVPGALRRTAGHHQAELESLRGAQGQGNAPHPPPGITTYLSEY